VTPSFRTLTAVLALAVTSGCTAVDTAVVPSSRQPGEIFVTAGNISEPHDIIGLVQTSRSGVRLFGFFDPVGTDLQSGFERTLIPQIREMGGDGAINVRFHQTQYLTVTKVVFAFLFFLPLPSQVTITGQVVKLRR
jgi:hypothetical protein